MRAINHSKKLETFGIVGTISWLDIARAKDQNVANSIQEDYPSITLTYLQQWKPKVVFNCRCVQKIFALSR
jgi:hypothetical protein